MIPGPLSYRDFRETGPRWRIERQSSPTEESSGKWEVGSGKLEVGSPKLEIGGRKSEVRRGKSNHAALSLNGQKSEIRSSNFVWSEVWIMKSWVWNLKSEVWSRKSEVGSRKTEVGRPSSAFVVSRFARKVPSGEDRGETFSQATMNLIKINEREQSLFFQIVSQA